MFECFFVFQILNILCLTINLITVCKKKKAKKCPVRNVGNSIRGNVTEGPQQNSTQTSVPATPEEMAKGISMMNKKEKEDSKKKDAANMFQKPKVREFGKSKKKSSKGAAPAGDKSDPEEASTQSAPTDPISQGSPAVGANADENKKNASTQNEPPKEPPVKKEDPDSTSTGIQDSNIAPVQP
ncbi:unnamed protein product [Caenorhabditis angaria]|uniref:Uncharacterized protein n=1 Tax=Caenorhabditis angaria TaxID=860376 RepID=A0A9P1MZF1_9PELO|nr:unnamed protein product [Caenorhabditis angaria]